MDYVKESFMGLLPQRNRREEEVRRKDTMFSCVATAPFLKRCFMLAQHPVANGEAAVGIGGLQRTRNMQQQ